MSSRTTRRVTLAERRHAKRVLRRAVRQEVTRRVEVRREYPPVAQALQEFAMGGPSPWASMAALRADLRAALGMEDSA